MGSRGTAGLVHAVLDRDKNGAADEVIPIARGLNFPNGVALRDGALYVAEINRILRYDGIEGALKKPPKPVVVNDSYPKDEHHGQKFIAFGPDGKLYVPVGAPCNICLRGEPYASITTINPDGSGRATFAHGVRNTVGFDWHPHQGAVVHGQLYTGSMFPAEYRDQIFIAEHGSWNRSKKIGYRLSLVRLDGSRVKSYETFADGWLQGQEEWGRPVDVLVMPDGALLVSDDKASAIYRITYEPGR